MKNGAIWGQNRNWELNLILFKKKCRTKSNPFCIFLLTFNFQLSKLICIYVLTDCQTRHFSSITVTTTNFQIPIAADVC